MDFALLMRCSLVVFFLPSTPAPADEAADTQAGPAWTDQVQTYSMLPLLPDTAKKMHVSVNGIWAGISSDHPLLPSREMIPSVRKRYGNDVAAFVKDSHEARLIVCGIVNGIEGMESLREKYPNLEAMACRDAEGKPARNDAWLLMCTNNPDWIEAEVAMGQRSIDAGADVLHLDTPMGSAFLSSGFLRAGFCDYCLANFAQHLNTKFTAEVRKETLRLDQLDRQSLVARLKPRQQLDPKQQPFANDAPDDLLFREFIRCQEQASFDTRKQVLDRLRRYAQQQHRQVAFTTNAADLGTMNAFSHWVRGIMFADLVDFFVYEQDVLPTGMPAENLMPLPRGKWAAYHKLAYAIHGRRSPAVIHASQMGKFLMDVMVWRRRTMNHWFGALAAEAYAANGAFVLYQIEAPFGMTSGLQRFWGRTGELNRFVREHPDLYDGPLTSGSTVAFLVLLSEKSRTIPGVFPSYLGFATALVEGSYPFDVLFAGDGHYVRDRLRPEHLQPYDTVVVPSPISPTENQKQMLQDYVGRGGRLVVQEPQRLGFEEHLDGDSQRGLDGSAMVGKGRVLKLAGNVTATGTDDLGSRFFKSYDAVLRNEIHQLASSLGLAAVLGTEHTGLVSAFPVVRPDGNRVVVHLVNYDVDTEKDVVREKTNVKIELPSKLVRTGRLKAQLHGADFPEPQDLEIEAGIDTITCEVPRLRAAASVVILSD